MAFSLSSFNTSGFRVLRSSVADLSEFIIILTPYLPSSDFSELEIKLTYSSAFEYYFSVSLDGQPVPYDFQSDNIRIQMFSSEEYAFFKVEYPVECYVSSCPESLFLEQTLLPFTAPDNGSGDGVSSESASILGDLSGHFCKFAKDDEVEVTSGNYPSPLKVVSSELILVDENVVTPVYNLDFSGRVFRVPQSFLKKYISSSAS